MKHYVDSFGMYLYAADTELSEGDIKVDPSPEYADQVWQFPGWGPSLEKMKAEEVEWQSLEMLVISNQLLAIEEEAEDALPGTRKQWLAYRTSVRLWHESLDFPDATRRPVRPA